MALCRPFGDPSYATPASNQQIADELVMSVDTVKGTLSALFEAFGIDELPQNQKRASAREGVATGVDHPARPLVRGAAWRPRSRRRAVSQIVRSVSARGLSGTSMGCPPAPVPDEALTLWSIVLATQICPAAAAIRWAAGRRFDLAPASPVDARDVLSSGLVTQRRRRRRCSAEGSPPAGAECAAWLRGRSARCRGRCGATIQLSVGAAGSGGRP